MVAQLFTKSFSLTNQLFDIIMILCFCFTIKFYKTHLLLVPFFSVFITHLILLKVRIISFRLQNIKFTDKNIIYLPHCGATHLVHRNSWLVE